MEYIYESVLDAVGRTPLIRLTRVTQGISTPVYLKAEFLNPGGSVKDRAARHMVAAAERDGLLRPGGVIVEGTSGNTGIGLAIVAAQRGYRAVVVVPDKTSEDKIAVLRAYGAEVVVTPGGRPREHPEHVSQLARRIAEETPGGWFANQYDNPANPQAHVDTTGPEIWAQTAGRITHYVAGIGTGGTVSGTGAHLKRVSDGAVRVIGVDPEHSTYGGGDGSPYYVESIGHYRHPDTTEDLWPESYHPGVLDAVERVADRDAITLTRDLARREGLLVGASGGAAVAAALRVARGLGPEDLVVVVAPDSGRNYLSKYFDDGWLRRNGFLDGDGTRPVLGDLLPAAAPLAVVPVTASVARAREVFAATGADVALVVLERAPAAPTRAAGDVVGALWRDALKGDTIEPLIAPSLPTAGVGEPVDAAWARIDEDWLAVLADGRVRAVLRRPAG
ncbi:pyridoxal-phosphate dependent enzyme [Dactylosporangium vinaceum]|uniref:PLP-dependent cysteine synthase family protein n=1 Tax=Dactylosporangium vinaceum TaxID=53362 RepID=A0ABV5M344_9ACTN|nr:pyridoxal-phosphate dependent enzyme [Dactylosporangium vinaceum]UAB99789.1 pyridoxal-phosphate dependent enzyme [Dactylosporangium vinaceum]